MRRDSGDRTQNYKERWIKDYSFERRDRNYEWKPNSTRVPWSVPVTTMHLTISIKRLFSKRILKFELTSWRKNDKQRKLSANFFSETGFSRKKSLSDGVKLGHRSFSGIFAFSLLRCHRGSNVLWTISLINYASARQFLKKISADDFFPVENRANVCDLHKWKYTPWWQKCYFPKKCQLLTSSLAHA